MSQLSSPHTTDESPQRSDVFVQPLTSLPFSSYALVKKHESSLSRVCVCVCVCVFATVARQTKRAPGDDNNNGYDSDDDEQHTHLEAQRMDGAHTIPRLELTSRTRRA